METPGSAAPNSRRMSQARPGDILDALRRNEARTTSELADIFKIARSTVTERISELARAELIVSTGEVPSGQRGRPAAGIAFNERARLALVAHVGMTGTMVAVTDLHGDPLWTNQVDLDAASGPDSLVELLKVEFEKGLLSIGSPARPIGIGIGLPGDLELATVYRGLTGVTDARAHEEISSPLEKHFSCPVLLERDVNLMALGEHRLAWPDSKILLSVKVGTVIACGVVIGDHVVQGANGLAGEIGHIKVAGGSLACTCGSQGCLNTVAGGPALAEQLRFKGLEAHTARDVAQLANQGVAEASQVVRQAGIRVGEVLASSVQLLNPDVITFWGYLVDSGDQFLAGVQEAILKTALPSSARSLRLERSPLGDDAGLRGAALSVIESTMHPDAIDRLLEDAPAGGRS